MSELADLLAHVNLGLYTAVAVVAFAQWRRRRGRGALWTALAFGMLALVVDAGRLLDAVGEGGTVEAVARRLIVAVLALFPYFLYRFTTAFHPPRAAYERLLGLMTLVVVAWTFLLPEIPEEGEPRSALFGAYVVAFTVHWVVLTVVVAWRLWRAGSGQPGVARRRMRTFAFAAATIAVALIVSASTDEDALLAAVAQALGSVSALAFLLALTPPSALRNAWRSAETAKVQQTIGDLMTAVSPTDVVERVLQPMAELVGAGSVELCGADGSSLGSWGTRHGERVEVALPSGGKVVLGVGAYAPYFGRDELETVRTLGTLAELALDRARLFAQEREAREVLEQAAELKSNFVALAAHELRNPVTVVHGMVETLERLGPTLPEERRVEMRRALLVQTTRLQLLVGQLLDLSRLDAEAIAIEPEDVHLRDLVEAVVTTAAGARRDEVRVDVPQDLHAHVDPQVLDRVLSNLVVNALRYGEAPVTVRAEQRDRHFRLTIEDRGPGVAPEFVPNLFERFTRSDRSSGSAEGTGLGLAIARSYARAHRGDLVYEPAEPTGARFQLVIPTTGNS